MAYRKEKEFFLCGHKTRSDAVAAGQIEWAIDDDTLREMEKIGIKVIAFRVEETKDYYLTPITNFLDSSLYQYRNYASRGGELQRYLNLRHFKVHHGKTKVK